MREDNIKEVLGEVRRLWRPSVNMERNLGGEFFLLITGFLLLMLAVGTCSRAELPKRCLTCRSSYSIATRLIALRILTEITVHGIR